MIDAHTHVQSLAYDKNRDEIIKRAQVARVKMITVGTQYETSKSGVELAEKYPKDIWASVGFHPTHAVSRPDSPTGEEGPREAGKWHHDLKEQKNPTPEIFDLEKFRKLASHPKVVAIGECGLDYYRIRNEELRIKEAQKEIFIEQAKLAKEFNKALMIHCRPQKGTDDAYEDLLSIIHDSLSIIPRILHFYVGSLSITKKLVEAGFYFTFGGVITFSHDYDEVIKYIPLERILLETDAPYVAPAPYRGKQNEPSYILEIAKKMAEIKGTSYENILKSTTATACKLFKITV